MGPAIRAAVEEPFEARSLEVPIGDDPQWFELRVTPVVDSGRCQQVLVAGVEHTTQHDVEKRHRRERCRFEAMVEHAPGLVLLTDSAGRIVKASTGVTRLLGLDAQELLGRPVFQLMHPDTLARAASIFNHILGLPGEPLRISDFRLGHADHTYRSCDRTITNLLHDDDVAAIVFNAHDVTELVLAEQRLERATSSDALTGLPIGESSWPVSARHSSGVSLHPQGSASYSWTSMSSLWSTTAWVTMSVTTLSRPWPLVCRSSPASMLW